MEERASRSGGSGEGRLAAFFERRRLSPTQRRLARYILDHPREVPFLSAVELAARVGVSQPSVTRLAVALGFRGYGDFQRELRRIALSGSGEETGNKFQRAVTAEIENLKLLRDSLGDAGEISALGRGLAASEPLVVLGLRASAPMAEYFGYFAEKVHPDVRVLTCGGSVAADRLAHARHAGGDRVLCFLLPRHPRETLEALSYARRLGFSISVVTDRRTEAVLRLSDDVLTVGMGTRLVFDSQAAAMVLAGVLLEALSDAFSGRAQARLEDFEQRAAELEWFVIEEGGEG
ncbi:MurR/RpiR family transcriptional regulator [Rubrobacter taiwanensis]|jgi:DNA-binding MurR/RpiR family transcriptional regulator|uniref:MurR/RpiR family transcriptional regulator n=1 Tax=Rubrobacter taiwanensis TaxID=185139 RepID=A0A4V2NWQ9_9ACTN|nr:MurR/RpiR family transcriptional regulator [Rubrobacter taiwanensis]TCJ18312.1 MurR/RpiR family transcriptional regulator [Rubrobacter taiwanensis]